MWVQIEDASITVDGETKGHVILTLAVEQQQPFTDNYKAVVFAGDTLNRLHAGPWTTLDAAKHEAERIGRDIARDLLAIFDGISEEPQ
jgi:hypothetical protein